jgi:hypothetical protein
VKGATAMPAGKKIIEFNKRVGSGEPTIPSYCFVKAAGSTKEKS